MRFTSTIALSLTFLVIFVSAVVGLFGHPAATEILFAVACAFASAADPVVPEETATPPLGALIEKPLRVR